MFTRAILIKRNHNFSPAFSHLPIPKACVSPIFRDGHIPDLKIRVSISCNSIVQNPLNLE